MMLDDPPRSGHTLPPLDDQPWEAINPRYKIVMRVRLLMLGLPLVVAPWLTLLSDDSVQLWHYLSSAILLLGLLALVLLWVPRKVRRTQYLLRQLDLNLRTGWWWYASQSVAINRVQHLEVTQGPLERLCGLCALVVYTAGGYQADLKIPGLERDLAHRIKAHLTDRTAEEAPEHASDD